MERSRVLRAFRTTLGLLAAGPLLAVLVVGRALPVADLDAAGLGWVLPTLNGVLLVGAAGAALAWLVTGLRHGAIGRLLQAGASAALAGGALAMLAGADSILPAIGAALALAGAALADRLGLAIAGQGRRIALAVGVIAIVELTVLAELLPGLAATVEGARLPVAAVGVAAAILAATVGIGRAAAPIATAVLVGIAATAVMREGGIEIVVSLAALIGSQLVSVLLATEPATPGDVDGDENERLPELASRLADAVLRFDGRLRLRDWNATAATLLGLDDASHGIRLEELLGVPISDLPHGVGAASSTSGVGGLRVDLQRSGQGLTAIIRDPATSPETERLGRELRGTIEELLQARRTIDLQRRELERAATVDPLTGVTSRSALMERLRVEVAQARRYQHPVAVVLLDVDGFSELNRAHGLAGGDAVLREVALRVRLRVRESDELGRLGSDAFLAVLPHTDEAGATIFADALQHRLGLRHFAVGDSEIRITASVGVAIMRAGEDLDADGLLARAHDALHASRGRGGGPPARTVAHLGDHRPGADVADSDAAEQGEG